MSGGWWRWLPAEWGVGFLVALAPAAMGLISLRWVRREARVASRATAGGDGGWGDATALPSSPKDGLISWWRADGDGKDSVGNHDGEFPFGIRFRPGVKGQAFDFRRSFAIEDILRRVSIQDSPDFQLSETFTLEARIDPQRPGGIILLRGDERPGFDTWQLDLLTPGKISFNFDDAVNKSAELLAPIAFGKWQHVVATFERGAMKIYVDGELVASAQTQLRPNATLDPRQNA